MVQYWISMQQRSFERILSIVCSVLDAYSAVLFLAEDEPGGARVQTPESYRLASVYSLGDKVTVGASVYPGKGLIGWILRNREPLLVPHFDRHKHQLEYYPDNEEVHIKAFMGCPLPGGLGALCVDSKRQYSFSEKDQKILHLFAELLAELISGMEYSQTQKQSLTHYDALRTVYTLRRQHSRWGTFLRNFLDLLIITTGFRYAVFCALHPNEETFGIEGETFPIFVKRQNIPSQFSIQNGAIGWVFRNDAPLFSDDAGTLPESSLFGKGVTVPVFQHVMAFPLVLQKKTRGVLCLASQTPVSVSEGTREFVRMASEHLALFLENLYVKCRLRDVCQAMAQAQTDEEPDLLT